MYSNILDPKGKSCFATHKTFVCNSLNQVHFSLKKNRSYGGQLWDVRKRMHKGQVPCEHSQGTFCLQIWSAAETYVLSLLVRNWPFHIILSLTWPNIRRNPPQILSKAQEKKSLIPDWLIYLDIADKLCIILLSSLALAASRNFEQGLPSPKPYSPIMK